MQKLTKNDLLDSSKRTPRYGNQIKYKEAMKARLVRIKNNPIKEQKSDVPKTVIVDVDIRDAADISSLESALLELKCMGLNIKTKLFIEAIR